MPATVRISILTPGRFPGSFRFRNPALRRSNSSSSPGLFTVPQGGVYYIAVWLYSGVATSGSITATVTGDGRTPPPSQGQHAHLRRPAAIQRRPSISPRCSTGVPVSRSGSAGNYAFGPPAKLTVPSNVDVDHRARFEAGRRPELGKHGDGPRRSSGSGRRIDQHAAFKSNPPPLQAGTYYIALRGVFTKNLRLRRP